MLGYIMRLLSAGLDLGLPGGDLRAGSVVGDEAATSSGTVAVSSHRTS